MQKALLELVSDLLPWFEFTHGQPSSLFCRSELLWSTQGTQQGDPLGPAFFAVVIQKAISTLQEPNCSRKLLTDSGRGIRSSGAGRR